jgi:hypothetical protein
MSDVIKTEDISPMIHWVRHEKVMLDRDLAALYGVETRALKQAVRRNAERFPNDFMFVLSKEEFEDWRSQVVMSKADRQGLRHPPMAFTEQGVAMLEVKQLLADDTALKSKPLIGFHTGSESE